MARELTPAEELALHTRQANCEHRCIKGLYPDVPERCVHCGIDEKNIAAIPLHPLLQPYQP